MKMDLMLIADESVSSRRGFDELTGRDFA